MWLLGMAITQVGLRSIIVTDGVVNMLGISAVLFGGLICVFSGPFEVSFGED